jgi:2-dehydro-3-deoxyglucarate aldolase/4-hydroxy-2-oxoheptanedioate aldolase
MTRDRRVKVGHFMVEFATPGVGHMLRNAGCDFVLFDMEHSGFGYETIKAVLRFFEAAGVPAIVRPPSKDYHHVARLLDMGAEGLMAPMVGSAAEARAVVQAMKYTPEGGRGVALGIAHDRYAGGPVLEGLAAANARSTLVALIETAAGVAEVDAIAATPGVDCLWLGHFDLSASMGIPGEFEHPRFLAAVEAMLAACRRHGRSVGRMVSDPEAGVAAHAQGFDFVCYSGDVWLYQAALATGVGAIRAGCAG